MKSKELATASSSFGEQRAESKEQGAEGLSNFNVQPRKRSGLSDGKRLNAP
jgi:hypothetical protein